MELKLFKIHRGSNLIGKKISKIDPNGLFGCGIAAIERDGAPVTQIDSNLILKPGDLIALIGSPTSIDAFIAYNVRKNLLRR